MRTLARGPAVVTFLFLVASGALLGETPSAPEPTLLPSAPAAATPPGTPVPGEATAGQARVAHPAWSADATIYEVNVRQYTPSGTFAEFETHLPRLKDLGVGILWFMPINPIGEVNRKGTLGSYYSVKDYRGVNPEFGTIDDFRRLVDHVHSLGMYAIIDWVANHSAWDNGLTVTNPDWYVTDAQGNFKPPVPDWSDVVELDYSVPELRHYMIDAMKYWVEEAGIDGFRCDVAEMVPLDFWVEARQELEAIKPVFMLAEGESPALNMEAFDATYGWTLFKLLRQVAEGQITASDLWIYFEGGKLEYPDDAYRMYFTSNHDENSWNGTSREFFGDALGAMAVIVSTVKGIPMVYSGEESGLNKRLPFFEKDSIPWREDRMGTIYKTLFDLKRSNRALWNGVEGGPMVRVPTSKDNAVFAFMRTKGKDQVFVAANLSTRTQNVELRGTDFPGIYLDVFSGESVTLAPDARLKLKPWAYRVLSAQSP